jgi:hypothetical protein
MDRVPDEVVDAVEIVRGTDYYVMGRAPAGDPGVGRVLAAFVTVARGDGQFLVEGARQRQSRAIDGGAFAFSDISGEDGVVIEVGAGRCVVVSEAAFARLIERLQVALTTP